MKHEYMQVYGLFYFPSGQAGKVLSTLCVFTISGLTYCYIMVKTEGKTRQKREKFWVVTWEERSMSPDLVPELDFAFKKLQNI